MSDCVFCKVVAGDIPSDVVAETDLSLAFRDINPVAPVHVLIIPKAHASDSAADLGGGTDGLLDDLFGLAARVAAQEGLSSWRLVTNVGADASQSVFHLHFHLLGGRRFGWPPG